MLSKLYEWYRIVNVKPDDATIEKRKLAVTDLLKHLSEAKDSSLLVASTAAVTNGFDKGFDQESKLVQVVVECIRSHQPAFPSDLSENALELRVCSAIALGEIITRHGDKRPSSKEKVQLASSLIVSAMGIRPKTKQKYLEDVLQELNCTALVALDKYALVQRQRIDIDLSSLDDLEPASDLKTFWDEFLPELKACFSNLEQQVKADREELEVLWWLYNGFSETANKQLIDLTASVAALCCGAEVAGRVATPPLDSVRQMVLGAVIKGRKEADLVGKPLKQMISEWKDNILDLLIPTDPSVRDIVQNFPPLLPLSWICSRIHDSHGASGWNQEFSLKTGTPASSIVSPAAIAVQAFNELIAQRIYSDIHQDEA